MKKFKIFILMMIIPFFMVAVSCGNNNKITESNAISVTTEDELKDAINSDDDNISIVLDNDIVIANTLVVEKSVTIDFNGKTLSNETDIWDTSTNSWSLISVRENGNLTIDGNGSLISKENDCYTIDLKDETAKCKIMSGTFVGNISVVYVYSGSLEVYGGNFSILQLNSNNVQSAYDLTLNCYDSAYTSKMASIVVYGGSYVNFNPAENGAESGKNLTTNFVADGYLVSFETIEKDDSSYVLYTVSK